MRYRPPRLVSLEEARWAVGSCADGLQTLMTPACASGTEASGGGGCTGGAAAEFGCADGAVAGTTCAAGAGNDPAMVKAGPKPRVATRRRIPATPDILGASGAAAVSGNGEESHGGPAGGTDSGLTAGGGPRR